MHGGMAMCNLTKTSHDLFEGSLAFLYDYSCTPRINSNMLWKSGDSLFQIRHSFKLNESLQTILDGAGSK
jgi:hypothetical protein